MSIDSPEKRIEIDMVVTASNGCEFHVVGWVDISFSLSGFSVSGYDFTASGPCGSFHFQGLVAPPSGNDEDLIVPMLQLKAIVTDIVNGGI